MSNTPPEYSHDWWKANDGKWYPPERHPDYRPPVTAPDPVPRTTSTRPDSDGPGDMVTNSRPSTLRVMRILGFVLLALAGVVVTVSGPDGGSDEISSARLDGSLNAELTESAPQQQVANGWETNDLLEVIAERSTDNRPAYLLFLLLLAACWYGITATVIPTWVLEARGNQSEAA